MKDEDNGSGWPTQGETLIFWGLILSSVMVVGVAVLKVLQSLGWVQ